MKTRICRLCGEEKELKLFEIDKRKKGHRTSRCKACKTTLEDKAVRAFRHLRNRAAANGTKVEVTLPEIKKLFEVFEGTCVYCGAKESPDGPTFHCEHVISRNAGGRDHISNLVIACPSCNSRKREKPVVSHYFYDERFKESHFKILMYYLSLTSGQPANIIVDDLVEAHADYQIEEIFKEC